MQQYREASPERAQLLRILTHVLFGLEAPDEALVFKCSEKIYEEAPALVLRCFVDDAGVIGHLNVYHTSQHLRRLTAREPSAFRRNRLPIQYLRLVVPHLPAGTAARLPEDHNLAQLLALLYIETITEAQSRAERSQGAQKEGKPKEGAQSEGTQKEETQNESQNEPQNKPQNESQKDLTQNEGSQNEPQNEPQSEGTQNVGSQNGGEQLGGEKEAKTDSRQAEAPSEAGAAPSLPEASQAEADEADPAVIAEYRGELRALLRQNASYVPEKLLEALPAGQMLEERCIVLSRLHEHAQALAILLYSLRNVETAYRYCAEVCERTDPRDKTVYQALVHV